MNKRLRNAFIATFTVYALYRFFHAALIDSMDFTVYWRTAQIWINSDSAPYEVRAIDRGFVLKQPPWILPFFATFGWLSLSVSSIVWALIELLCLGVTLSWLKQAGVSNRKLIIAFLMFWWLWLAHFYAGQLNLVLLASALLAFPSKNRPPVRGARAMLPIIYSFKLFPIVTLLGRWRAMTRARVLLGAIAIFLTLNGLIWFREFARPHVGPAEAIDRVASIYRDWPKAAASGGTELGEEIIRGQGNHGFTAAVLRWSGVPATRVNADIFVAFAVAVALSTIWFIVSMNLDADERWAGWIVVGLLCHPLVWHHVFVMAFPLAALSIDRSARGWPRILAYTGTFMMGLLVQELWGKQLVTPLELAASKAWGAVFCATALVATRQRTL